MVAANHSRLWIYALSNAVGYSKKQYKDKVMSVTICIPTYNRKRFEKVVEYNIASQTYMDIRVLIADDGDEEPFVLDIPFPYEIIKLPKKISLGQKRNLLCNQAKTEFIAFMDDDDFYQAGYIEYAVWCLTHSKMRCFGSSSMLLVYPDHDWRLCAMVCDKLFKTHEATLVFTKEFWEEQKFHGNTGEGQNFLWKRDKEVFQGDIAKIMVCVCHDSNTIDKQRWVANKIPDDVRPNIHVHRRLYERSVLQRPG